MLWIMQTHNESSVLFNLQELMRIEHDRVEAEHAATRALEEQAAERQREQVAAVARAEAEQRAAEQARERALADEAARLEVARAVALEQTRMAMAATERAERQRLEQQHAEAMARLAPAPGLGLRHGILALCAVGVIALLGYFGAVDPMLRESRALEAQARALAEHYTREIDALRRTPLEVAQPVVVADAPVSAQPVTEEPTKRVATKTKRGRGTTHTKVDSHSGNEALIDPLDSEDDDPLRGL